MVAALGLLVVKCWVVPLSEPFTVKNSDILRYSSCTSRRVSGIYVDQSYFRMSSSIMSGRRLVPPLCRGHRVMSNGYVCSGLKHMSTDKLFLVEVFAVAFLQLLRVQ